MVKKWFIYFLMGLFICFGIIFSLKNNAQPAVKFFPIDEKESFQIAETNLDLNSEKGPRNSFTWTSNSKSEQALYLRQDISLLYENGKFKGVQSKWKEDTDAIQLEEKVPLHQGSIYQAISYHHGEKHGKEEIKSLQHMSFDQLKPSGETIELQTKQNLIYHWNQLLDHFNIDLDSYLSVPLIDLHKYNNNNLPSLTQSQTDKVIGQLWEGLYKNYVIPVGKKSNNKQTHYIPLVLFDKKATHLLVLFELNGKKERLIQQFSNE